MSVTKTFTFTTSWRSAPAARRIVRMFSSVCRVSALAPPATSSNEPGLVPSVPATKMKPPAFAACENARSLPSSCTLTFWMSAMKGDGTIAAMKLAGVHHVSLNVDDAEKTGRFYIEVLGLEVLPRPDFPFKGYWLRSGAHAIRGSSPPVANAELAGPDVDVRLEFNSRIDAARSTLQIAKDGGALAPLALAESKEPNLLNAKAAGLAPGAYRLRWQVLSGDGHVSPGDVNFKVRAP